MAAVAISSTPSPSLGQVGTVTPEQAARMLQTQPQLAEVVQERLRESGLTPEQIRARLRAAGYPSDFLDPYIQLDSVTALAPPENMLQVMSVLGVRSLSRQDSLLLAGDTVAQRLAADSLRADSIARTDSLAPLQEGLELFGLAVFRQPTTAFQPLVTGPVDDSYVLGPGDVLVLILTGEVEQAYQLEVTRGGFFVIPGVGRISVNNITLGQLRELLYDRLALAFSGVRRGSNPRTRFDVTVASVRVHTVRVVGEVNRPGSYQIAATGTVLSAIYQAAGLTERANFRAVEVRRGSELLATVDLYEYLIQGETPSEVRLAAGDVVFIPIRGPRIKVAGEVTRPGVYEIKTGEGLREVTAMAGGLTAEALMQAATIERILPPDQRQVSGRSRTLITVPLGDALRPGAELVPMFDGDSLSVFSIPHIRRGAVTIGGSVWQPGTYQLKPGMRLWDLVQTAGGLRPETYQGRAQIVRLLPDSTRWMLGVSLPAPDGPPGPTDNPLLQESDEVTIFSKSEFRARQYVAVRGAVRNPGLVPFSDSMTLRDAVLLAGGLRENAYLLEAEVSRLRLDLNGSNDSLALVMRVPLDSSYVITSDAYVRRPIGESTSPEIRLHPHDNLFIRQQPGWEVQRNVFLTGEVTFPGPYSLVTRDERLLSVITRAGGLTPQAYPNGVRFFRTEGNLPEVLGNPGHRDNLALAAGDSIHIPRYIPTVRVEGAVNSPASVPYVPGSGIGYYVTTAGGYSRQADKGATFVQQSNGLIQKGKRPEPGAIVFVPTKEPGGGGIDLLTLTSAITGILASITTIILVLQQK
jgi:protein involved in polysaccharide export with SLBB domain